MVQAQKPAAQFCAADKKSALGVLVKKRGQGIEQKLKLLVLLIIDGTVGRVRLKGLFDFHHGVHGRLNALEYACGLAGQNSCAEAGSILRGIGHMEGLAGDVGLDLVP